mgnify:CR=1 FL=1
MGRQKIIKTGNSLAVTIPARFTKSIGVKAGDEVKVKVEPEKGRIVYHFSGVRQLPLSQNFIKRKKKK